MRRQLPTGIFRTKHGYRVFQWIPAPDRPRGRLMTKRFPFTATLDEMTRWREDQHTRARCPSPPEPATPPVRRRPHEATNYVYFVQVGDCVKIGRTTNLNKRLEALRTANVGRARLMAKLAAPPEIEKRIHYRFWHLRQAREWYALTPELAQFINSVALGADIATLFASRP